MTRVRRPLAGLVVLFTAAIAVDRVGLSRGSDAVGSHVYAIAALAVIAPLVLGGLRRTRPWLVPSLAIGAYLTIGAAAGALAISRFDIYVAVTEAGFLVLASWLAQRVAVTLAELDETLGAVAFGENPAIDIESPSAAIEINAEMTRSRRHDRPMSVLVLEPDSQGFAAAVRDASTEVDRAVRTRYVLGKLARAVGDQLRRSDLLFEHRASGRLFIVSPETDDRGMELLVQRVVEAAARVGVPTDAGSASFPSDAIGFDGLIEAAEQALSARRAPQPLLRAVHNGGGS